MQAYKLCACPFRRLPRPPSTNRLFLSLYLILAASPNPSSLFLLYTCQIASPCHLYPPQDGWNFCTNCAYKNSQAQASCAYHFVVMGAGGVGKSAVTIQVRLLRCNGELEALWALRIELPLQLPLSVDCACTNRSLLWVIQFVNRQFEPKVRH